MGETRRLALRGPRARRGESAESALQNAAETPNLLGKRGVAGPPLNTGTGLTPRIFFVENTRVNSKSPGKFCCRTLMETAHS